VSVWDGLRLVALDLEACRSETGWRVVSVGMVSRRAAGASGSYEQWINPGVPIDPGSARVHRLTDALVAREPSFARAAPDILRRLSPEDGEAVVLVAHNAAFDIPILRSEFLATSEAMPDLPVLDTMRGLRRLAGFDDGPAGLLDMMAAVGLTPISEDEHHGALADARACAELAVRLIERAEARGLAPDLSALLANAGGQRVSAVEEREFRPREERAARVPLPAAHAAAHDDLPADLVALIAECARLRCDRILELAERLPPEAVRRLLFAQLAASGAAGDRAGSSTVIGALAPLLPGIPHGIRGLRAEIPGIKSHTPGNKMSRISAMAAAGWIAATAAGRCQPHDYCPSCADGLPCPADTFAEALVELTITRTDEGMRDFWRYDRIAPGTGRTFSLIHAVSPPLADATLAEVLRHFDAHDPAEAVAIVDSIWAAGFHSPVIADRKVARILAGGREVDLRAALALCDEVLAARDGNTAQPWASLGVRRAQIEAALRRRADTGKRRHTPANPKRAPRPTRFLRALPT
jgi:DNA polymerase III epsilon subunit-like protein